MKIIVSVILLQISSVLPLPYQMLLQPQQQPDGMLQLLQQQMLQQQLLQMQMKRPDEPDYQMQWPLQPTPLLIIAMNNRIINEAIPNELVKRSEYEMEHKNESDDNIKETEDAVIIDAKPETNELHQQGFLIASPYQGKYILGQIIMAIPFLPFEVNVPDTVSWAWNGISSIIAGIGQRWPFNRPMPEQTTQEATNEVATKLLYKHLLKSPPTQGPIMPIFLIPMQYPTSQQDNFI